MRAPSLARGGRGRDAPESISHLASTRQSSPPSPPLSATLGQRMEEGARSRAWLLTRYTMASHIIPSFPSKRAYGREPQGGDRGARSAWERGRGRECLAVFTLEPQSRLPFEQRDELIRASGCSSSGESTSSCSSFFPLSRPGFPPFFPTSSLSPRSRGNIMAHFLSHTEGPLTREWLRRRPSLPRFSARPSTSLVGPHSAHCGRRQSAKAMNIMKSIWRTNGWRFLPLILPHVASIAATKENCCGVNGVNGANDGASSLGKRILPHA